MRGHFSEGPQRDGASAKRSSRNCNLTCHSSQAAVRDTSPHSPTDRNGEKVLLQFTKNGRLRQTKKGGKSYGSAPQMHGEACGPTPSREAGRCPRGLDASIVRREYERHVRRHMSAGKQQSFRGRPICRAAPCPSGGHPIRAGPARRANQDCDLDLAQKTPNSRTQRLRSVRIHCKKSGNRKDAPGAKSPSRSCENRLWLLPRGLPR